MKQTTIVLLLLAMAGLLALSITGGPRSGVSAEEIELPPIFVSGAKLIGPLGPVTVLEVTGNGWIHVESHHPLYNGTNHWIYVPAQTGAWALAKPEKDH